MIVAQFVKAVRVSRDYNSWKKNLKLQQLVQV